MMWVLLRILHVYNFLTPFLYSGCLQTIQVSGASIILFSTGIATHFSFPLIYFWTLWFSSRSLKRARDIRDQLEALLDRVEVKLLTSKNPITIRKAMTAGYYFHAAHFSKGCYKTAKHQKNFTYFQILFYIISSRDGSSTMRLSLLQKSTWGRWGVAWMMWLSSLIVAEVCVYNYFPNCHQSCLMIICIKINYWLMD